MEDSESDDEDIVMPLLIYLEDYDNKEEKPHEPPSNPPSAVPTPEHVPPNE